MLKKRLICNLWFAFLVVFAFLFTSFEHVFLLFFEKRGQELLLLFCNYFTIFYKKSLYKCFALCYNRKVIQNLEARKGAFSYEPYDRNSFPRSTRAYNQKR